MPAKHDAAWIIDRLDQLEAERRADVAGREARDATFLAKLAADREAERAAAAERRDAWLSFAKGLAEAVGWALAVAGTARGDTTMMQVGGALAGAPRATAAGGALVRRARGR